MSVRYFFCFLSINQAFCLVKLLLEIPVLHRALVHKINVTSEECAQCVVKPEKIVGICQICHLRREIDQYVHIAAIVEAVSEDRPERIELTYLIFTADIEEFLYVIGYQMHCREGCWLQIYNKYLTYAVENLKKWPTAARHGVYGPNKPYFRWGKCIFLPFF